MPLDKHYTILHQGLRTMMRTELEICQNRKFQFETCIVENQFPLLLLATYSFTTATTATNDMMMIIPRVVDTERSHSVGFGYPASPLAAITATVESVLRLIKFP